MPVAIRAEHLCKRYRIGAARRLDTARDAVAAAARSVVTRMRGSHRPSVDATELWAIDDVSFQLNAGETVGIIGRNGAGKSTLLKVISQITEPTRGFVDVAGRVGSLLEVGTGFHPDLTGRENTYMNGAILGMSRSEIDRKFDEIVAFAEVERFLDTPVKHYSSGMYMRLAFSVAAHLETEILVVDEVLAVGDAAFQRKCLGKMDDVSRHGRTVLFVSHNLEAIQRLCTRALLFEQGRLVADGPIGRVVSQYRSADRVAAGAGRFSARARRGTGWALVRDLALVDETGRAVASRAADADLVFQIDLELVDAARAGGSLRGLIVELVVCTDDGRPLVSLMSADDTGVELPPASSCRLQVRLTAPTFVPGRYRVQVFLGVPNLEHVDEIPDALELEIEAPVRPWRPYELYATRGVVCRHADWGCEVTDMPVAGQ